MRHVPTQAPSQLGFSDLGVSHRLVEGDLGFAERGQCNDSLALVGPRRLRDIALFFHVENQCGLERIDCPPQSVWLLFSERVSFGQVTEGDRERSVRVELQLDRISQHEERPYLSPKSFLMDSTSPLPRSCFEPCIGRTELRLPRRTMICPPFPGANLQPCLASHRFNWLLVTHSFYNTSVAFVGGWAFRFPPGLLRVVAVEWSIQYKFRLHVQRR